MPYPERKKMIETLKGSQSVLYCEGIYMFRGTCRVVPTNKKFPEETITGDWLYKQEYDCLYCNGRSYPADIVIVEEIKAISK